VKNQKMFSLIRLNNNPEVADIIRDRERLFGGLYQIITKEGCCLKGMLNILVDNLDKKSTDTSYQQARLHEKAELSKKTDSSGLVQKADLSRLVQKMPTAITLADFVNKKQKINKRCHITVRVPSSETGSTEIESSETRSIKTRSESSSPRSMS
jgi:hypothetical protein